MVTKRKRTKRSGFVQGDRVQARAGDTWRAGTVSRSLFRGTEVDVRCDDGTELRNLTSKDVKELLFVDDVNRVVHVIEGSDAEKVPEGWVDELKTLVKPEGS